MAKATKEEKEQCRVLTPEFRVSYPHVFKPQGMQGKKDAAKKYSITMLFPKDTDLTLIKKAMTNAKIQKFGPKEKWPKNLESCVSDGDSPKNADKEGYAGHWVIKAGSGEDQKPGVVDQNVEPIIDQSSFYPGCYARASCLAYIWDNEFGQGVGFILDHVQKMRDGKSFGGKPPADQVFSPVGTGTSEDFADSQQEEEQEESFM
jgi:hypothetical protein